jgi:hypothetical protein
MNEKVHELLAALRLKGMDQVLDEEIRRAEKEGVPAPEVLFRLLTEEQAYRQGQSPRTGHSRRSPSRNSRG